MKTTLAKTFIQADPDTDPMTVADCAMVSVLLDGFAKGTHGSGPPEVYASLARVMAHLKRFAKEHANPDGDDFPDAMAVMEFVEGAASIAEGEPAARGGLTNDELEALAGGVSDG